MELNLLDKTTFWIDDVELDGTDLGDLAAAAASVLRLPREEVMVVDVRPGLVAFDVVRPQVDAESIAGKAAALLARLSSIPGVTLGPAAAIHSEGVLGLIALDPPQAARALEATRSIAADVREQVARRAIVFASGSEVRDGKIRDTNSPYLAEVLGRAGHKVEFGGILEDDLGAVIARLEDVLGRGFGLVVTTGGVGAEDKDFNVEAIQRVAPGAHTPWILKFERDMRRHHKEGVRIAVGRVGPTLLVALPGPNDEVRATTEVLVSGLSRRAPDADLAEALAAVLRSRWQEKMTLHGGERDRHRGNL